jgi:hypothetical protein
MASAAVVPWLSARATTMVSGWARAAAARSAISGDEESTLSRPTPTPTTSATTAAAAAMSERLG